VNRCSKLFLLLLASGSLAAENPRPLLEAHAHNDYEHTRPLLDALDNGFCSVEADIYLSDGKLLVAHEARDLKAERTLEKLYLDPLKDRAVKKGGRIYPGGPTVTLLIDIKTDAEATYAALEKVLENYRAILTGFDGDLVTTNAVTAIITGNRPREIMLKEKRRLAAFDGRLKDLGANLSPAFMPLVSDNWQLHFKWNGIGPFPESEKQKLRQYVEQTHQEHRRLRFWATPDQENMWQVLQEAGVDLINTDKLEALNKFLNRK